MPEQQRRAIAKRALPMVDLTDLSETCSNEAIEHLCARAQTPFGPVGAICIWPQFIAHARQQLTKTSIAVATVVNFPSGEENLDQVITQTIAALNDGADEIDLVMPYKAFMQGDGARAQSMIVALRSATADKALLKVILETGVLQSDQRIAEASMMAIEAGADFIKTSTGKVAVNATLSAAEIMIDAIAKTSRAVGFKPAGGIKTTEDCGAYLAVADRIMGPDWASNKTFRFGASGVLDDLIAALRGEQTAAVSRGY